MAIYARWYEAVLRRSFLISLVFMLSALLVFFWHVHVTGMLLTWLDIIILSVFISVAAFIVARVAGRFIGGTGIAGFLTSLVVIALSTVATGVLAGTMFLPGPGTLAGVITALSIFMNAETFFFWLAISIAAQLAIKKLT